MEEIKKYINKEDLENILQIYKTNQIEGLALFRRALIPSFKQLVKGATTPYQNYSLTEFKTLLDELAQEK